MIVWHMGSLHAYEKALTLLLAFGPVVLLAVVLVVRRRADLAEEAAEAEALAAEAEQGQAESQA